MLVDLSNREIMDTVSGSSQGCSIGSSCLFVSEIQLKFFKLFHTDRGSESKNSLIDALDTFGIKRSLNEKGTSYDNAVAETTFKIIKTEFVSGRGFPSQFFMYSLVMTYQIKRGSHGHPFLFNYVATRSCYLLFPKTHSRLFNFPIIKLHSFISKKKTKDEKLFKNDSNKVPLSFY